MIQNKSHGARVFNMKGWNIRFRLALLINDGDDAVQFLQELTVRFVSDDDNFLIWRMFKSFDEQTLNR